jgi:RNA polymerase sigma factor (sigma-70 family)
MTKFEVFQIHPQGEQVLNGEINLDHIFEYELTQKAGRGDNEAFQQIYWRYNRLVYSLCLRMTKSREEAEDITQNIFVKLFREIGSFGGEVNFRSWLYRFTLNEVLVHCRKNKSRKEQTTNDDDEISKDFATRTEKAKAMLILDNIFTIKAIACDYKYMFTLSAIENYKLCKRELPRQSLKLLSLIVSTSFFCSITRLVSYLSKHTLKRGF